jgi:hypothetical protein
MAKEKNMAPSLDHLHDGFENGNIYDTDIDELTEEDNLPILKDPPPTITFSSMESYEAWLDAMDTGYPTLSMEMAKITNVKFRTDVPEGLIKFIGDNFSGVGEIIWYKDDLDRDRNDVRAIAIRYELSTAKLGGVAVYFGFVRDTVVEKFGKPNMIFRALSLQAKGKSFTTMYPRPSKELKKATKMKDDSAYFESLFKIISSLVRSEMFEDELESTTSGVSGVFAKFHDILGDGDEGKLDDIVQRCRALYEQEFNQFGKSQYTNKNSTQKR